jgi:hypothetical protein
VVKDENVVLLEDIHIILNIWENYYYNLLNGCGINDAGQTKMITAEHSSFEAEIAVEKLKGSKSQGTYAIPAESSSSSSSSSSLALEAGVGFSLLHNTPPFRGSSEGFVIIILLWCGIAAPRPTPNLEDQVSIFISPF